MCPPFVVDMDAVEGNDKVCGITAFLTTAYAILPQMSRSYVVFGKVRTLPFTTYIFVNSLEDHIQLRDAFFRLCQHSLFLCQRLVTLPQAPFRRPLDKVVLVLRYIPMLPTDTYYNGILEGYRQNGLPVSALKEAWEHAVREVHQETERINASLGNYARPPKRRGGHDR